MERMTGGREVGRTGRREDERRSHLPPNHQPRPNPKMILRHTLAFALIGLASCTAETRAPSTNPGTTPVTVGGRAEGDTLSIDDIVSANLIGEWDGVEISPDGKWVAYQMLTFDLAGNRKASDLYIIGADPGSQARKITNNRSSGQA